MSQENEHLPIRRRGISDPKARAWCFTANNPDKEPDAFKQSLIQLAPKYFCFGLEEAPTTGTLHYQGYIAFTGPISLQTAIRKLGGCHVERAKGDSLQNRDYCSKDATGGLEGNFIEWGERPLTAKEVGYI